MNIYIVYEINLWPFTVSEDFILGNSLFGDIKLTPNTDPNKHKYSGYGIGFDASGSSLLSNGSGFGKNVIIFVTDMSSSVHICNKKKNILILGKGQTQRLDNATVTAEKEYSIKFTEQNKKF